VPSGVKGLQLSMTVEFVPYKESSQWVI
jgi:hypothetical protein